MGVRLTGISTPVGGVSWEYIKAEEPSTPLPISPGQKIKVFISMFAFAVSARAVQDRTCLCMDWER